LPYGVKVSLPPLVIRIQDKETAERVLGEVFHLTGYESRVLAVLVSANRPMIASEVARVTGIPRTKVYGTMYKLVSAGFGAWVQITEKQLEATNPEIWSWWRKGKQSRWLNKRHVGCRFFMLNREYIESEYYRYTTELYRHIACLEETKRLLGELIEAIMLDEEAIIREVIKLDA